jgi:hypothetical protein
MEFEDFVQLPVADQALHYRELCRDLHETRQSRDQTQKELSATKAARESDRIDSHIADVAREKGAYPTFVAQVKARKPRRDDNGRVIVDGDHGEPLTVPQLADQWHVSPTMSNQFKDVVEAMRKGPPPPLNKEGTAIDPVALVKQQGTAGYINARTERGPAALGLRPSKYSQGR